MLVKAFLSFTLMLPPSSSFSPPLLISLLEIRPNSLNMSGSLTLVYIPRPKEGN